MTDDLTRLEQAAKVALVHGMPEPRSPRWLAFADECSPDHILALVRELRNLKEFVTALAVSEEECQCQHDDEDCCVLVKGAHCSRCEAAGLLGWLRIEP